jgi:hypothetical protein
VGRRIAATLALVLAGGVAACSGDQRTLAPGSADRTLPAADRKPFASVLAAVDESSASITLPMDAYVYSPEEWVAVSAANAYLIEDCVRAQGRPLREFHGDFEVREERPYGPWVMKSAEVNGWERGTVRTIAGRYDSGVRNNGEGDPDAYAAYQECESNLTASGNLLAELLPGQIAGETTVHGLIMMDANGLTAKDPEYREINRQWLGCIKAEGLTPDPSNGDWGVAVGNSSREQQIRDAVKDVRCKQKHSVMQRLSDIEAQYQAALMASKEAQLAELAKTKQDALAKASKVLAEHGA